jgi:hypothetical protein
VVADTRDCARCSTSFVPRREHAPFCCVRCRAAWNREHMGDPEADASALLWSLAAMSETTGRLRQVPARDRPHALAAIGEAVWWVTIVDATLVRHHPHAYDIVIASRPPERRELVEGTLAGLRFVRNRIGPEADPAAFLQPGKPGPDAGGGRITRWTWEPVPDPAFASLPPRGQAWELTRYRAYQAHLAGHTMGEVFGRAAAFLELAAAKAMSVTGAALHAAL